MIGESVLHFRILSELGHGGMGVVYRAHDSRLDREVALKFLTRTRDPRRLRPLIDEAIAASRLRVDSVVKIHADYESPQGPFLCMEYLPGGNLRERIEGGPVELHEALRIGIAVAQALEAAHAGGILHCDLKPANVLLSPGGEPAAKVTDFGLSRDLTVEPSPRRRKSPASARRSSGTASASTRTLSEETTRLSGPGRQPALAGTPAYMSPEQLRGGPLDARSDLFALGILLFEMATRTHPSQASSSAAGDRPGQADLPVAVRFFERHHRRQQVSAWHRQTNSGKSLVSPIQAGRLLRPEFPPAYWRLVGRLMAPDRERRPRDATAALRVLNRLLAVATTSEPQGPALPPLAGRDRELERLGEALTALIEGQGGAWLIEGAPGAGKTALTNRFGAVATNRGAVVLRGSALPAESPRAYRPFLDALEGFLTSYGAGADPEVCLHHEVGMPLEVATFLRSVLLTPRSSAVSAIAPAQLRDALRSFVQALTRERSVVLILEDLELADWRSAELFGSWVHASPEIPLLLIGTCDPERLAVGKGAAGALNPVEDWIRSVGSARTVALGPLDRDATEDILCARLPALPRGHHSIDLVHWRTGGLPGFVAEIARLAERSGNSLAAIEHVLGGVMPESIRASLALRVGRLGARDLELLRASAVAGSIFAPALLIEAGYGSGDELARRFQVFEQQHDLVRRERDERYRFHDPQVHEFILATMSPETVTGLHGKFADVLARRADEAPPQVVALHLLGAGRHAEAGRSLRAAAQSALSAFDEPEALRLADLAEQSLPTGKKSTALRRDVQLIRARALSSLGHDREALAPAEEAVRLARRERSQAALGEALLVLGSLQHALGDAVLAERTLRLAESRCAAGRSPRDQAHALLSRGHLRYRRGQLPAAAAFYRRALEAARRGADPATVARVRGNLANVQAEQGQLERATESYLEGLEFHRQRGDRRTAAVFEGNLGLVRLRQGRIDDARALFAASRATREEIGDRRGVAAMELRLARCRLTVGESRLALEHAAKAASIATRVGEAHLSCEAALIETESHLASGAPARATRRAQALLARARPLGERLEANALTLLIEGSLARGELQAAAGHARRLQLIGKRLGAQESGATARVLARLWLARGQYGKALRGLDCNPTSAPRCRQHGVDGLIDVALLRSAASAALSRSVGDAHDRAACRHAAQAEIALNRVAETLASTDDRRQYVARWKREQRGIERLRKVPNKGRPRPRA